MNEEYEEAIRKAKTFAGTLGTAWLLENGKGYKVVGHDTERIFYTNEKNGFGYTVKKTFTNVWNGRWYTIKVEEGEVCTQ